MTHLVVDNSVLLQAVLQPTGAVGPLLRLLRDGVCTLLYTQNLLEELVEVLDRPFIREKYHLQDEDIETIVQLIRLRSEIVSSEQWLQL